MIINLTPHTINIKMSSGEIRSIESSGEIRIKTEDTLISVVDGIPLYSTKYGEITGIPSEVVKGDIYIVSSMVRTALHIYLTEAMYGEDAPTVASPGELIRDVNGNPIACEGLRIELP